MTTKSLHYDAIELAAFKRRWPCHGLPDELESLTFVYATNGDLVDIDARDASDRYLDSADFDGPALLALSQRNDR